MPPSSEAMAWATTAWQNHLGEEHVVLDRALVRPTQTATYPTSSKTIVVLRPGSANEVASCLRIASAHNVPVKPVSGGARWGYGSRVAVASYSALLDLSRMNQLLAVDEDLGTLTVEPGVSFAMVHERLRQTQWVLPAPGSTPYASVIGNTVDGGVCDGLEPLRRRDVLALQAVLPNGEVVDTAQDAFAQSTVQSADLGTDLTSLFLQTNLGVVTRMTIALCRVPPNHASVHLGLVDPARLPALIDGLRTLKQDGVLAGSVTLFDTVRVLSASTGYPFAETGGTTPLPEDWLASAREALGGHHWFAEAAVRAASPEHLDAATDAVYARLTPLADAVNVSPGGAVAHFTHGVGANLLPAYWRKRDLPEGDTRHPDRDGAGVLWYGPAVPFRGELVAAVASELATITAAHDFEPNLSVRAIDDRTVIVLAGVLFDRETEDAEAMACFEALVAAGTARGLVPHRPGERGLSPSLALESGAVAFLRRLKGFVDPSDILAPGEGDLRAFWPDED